MMLPVASYTFWQFSNIPVASDATLVIMRSNRGSRTAFCFQYTFRLLFYVSLDVDDADALSNM